MRPPKTDAEKKVRDALSSIIRPIVLGQLRACRKDHPEMISPAGIASAEKRITNDLLSRAVWLRLRAVLCGYEPLLESSGDERGSRCGVGGHDGALPASAEIVVSASHVIHKQGSDL